MKNLVGKKLEGDGYVIICHSPKGGCGKTTTTTNLAATLIANGYSVQVIDVDIQGNANSTCNSYFKNHMQDGFGRLKVKFSPIKDSSDSLNKMSDMLSQTLKNPGRKHELGEDLIHVSAPIELLSEIPYLRSENDFVIIDTPGMSNPFLTELVFLSDLTIVPVYPSNYDLTSLTNLVRSLISSAKHHNIEPSEIPLISLINNCDKKDPLAKQVRELLNMSGLPCASTIIPRRNHYRKVTFANSVLGSGSDAGKPYFKGPKRDVEPCSNEQNELLAEIFHYLQHGFLPNQAQDQDMA